MEFFTCPNCLTVFGDVQSSCPTCSADTEGDGAEIEFDAATRTVIQGLGGLFGGILESSEGHVLWCSRGICMVREDIGLAWRARIFGSVDDVRIADDDVVVRSGAEETVFALVDGLERE